MKMPPDPLEEILLFLFLWNECATLGPQSSDHKTEVVKYSLYIYSTVGTVLVSVYGPEYEDMHISTHWEPIWIQPILFEMKSWVPLVFSMCGVTRDVCIVFLYLQLLRKRHIGNDIVTVIFQEEGCEPFSPRCIRSHFQHIFIVVRVEKSNTQYPKYRYVPAS